MSGMEYSTLTLLQRYEGKLGSIQWDANIWYTDAMKNNRGSVLTLEISIILKTILRGILSTQVGNWSGNFFFGKEWQSYTDTNTNTSFRDTNTYDQLTLQRFVKRESEVKVQYPVVI